LCCCISFSFIFEDDILVEIELQQLKSLQKLCCHNCYLSGNGVTAAEILLISVATA
jgi:hypothetical protein